MLVGDSKKAKEITKILAVELGMKYFYDFGGNEAIPLFNEMTKCWHGLDKCAPEKKLESNETLMVFHCSVFNLYFEYKLSLKIVKVPADVPPFADSGGNDLDAVGLFSLTIHP